MRGRGTAVAVDEVVKLRTRMVARQPTPHQSRKARQLPLKGKPHKNDTYMCSR